MVRMYGSEIGNLIRSRVIQNLDFFHKIPILLHTCATCSKLPSNISTIGIRMVGSSSRNKGSRKKSFFYFSGLTTKALPPPPGLRGPSTKERTFFAPSLTTLIFFSWQNAFKTKSFQSKESKAKNLFSH